VLEDEVAGDEPGGSVVSGPGMEEVGLLEPDVGVASYRSAQRS